MPTTISNSQVKQFASSPLEPTTSLRFTVETTLVDGLSNHDFHDLESALIACQRLLSLGFERVTIERYVEEYGKPRNPL